MPITISKSLYKTSAYKNLVPLNYEEKTFIIKWTANLIKPILLKDNLKMCLLQHVFLYAREGSHTAELFSPLWADWWLIWIILSYSGLHICFHPCASVLLEWQQLWMGMLLSACSLKDLDMAWLQPKQDCSDSEERKNDNFINLLPVFSTLFSVTVFITSLWILSSFHKNVFKGSVSCRWSYIL